MTVVDYNISPCKKCERFASSCDFPCQQYSDAELEQDLAKKNRDIELSYEIEKETVKVNNDTDIENFLDYSVEDIEWFQILNGKRTFNELFDKKALLEMMWKKHEKYCEDNGLCPECRGFMEKYPSYEDVRGAKGLVEYEYKCSKGC